MPPRIPGFCTLCGRGADLEDLLCPDCAALCESRQIVTPPVADTTSSAPRVTCHPSSADLMIAAGYTLLWAKIDPDTRVVYAQVWVKADEGC
jgi:hypothetical protein